MLPSHLVRHAHQHVSDLYQYADIGILLPVYWSVLVCHQYTAIGVTLPVYWSFTSILVLLLYLVCHAHGHVSVLEDEEDAEQRRGGSNRCPKRLLRCNGRSLLKSQKGRTSCVRAFGPRCWVGRQVVANSVHMRKALTTL